MEINLYEIDYEYNNCLCSKDPRVFRNEQLGQEHRRKYVGPFEVNGKKYFVPLSSWKEKHQKMSDGLDFIKLGKCAVMNINNMIPVPDGAYTLVNIDAGDDVDYCCLLKKEYKLLLPRQIEIKEKLLRVYNHKLVQKDSTPLARRCNDFGRLEKECERFAASLSRID